MVGNVLIVEDEPDIRRLIILQLEREGFRCRAAATGTEALRELLTYMMSDPKTIPRAIRLILISRFLERVGDHATNIAEMVIYMVESKMVRHSIA